MRLTTQWLLPWLLALLWCEAAQAESTLQLWTNFTVDWQVTERHFLSFDLEPKVLLVGSGQWRNVDYTQTYEYAPDSTTRGDRRTLGSSLSAKVSSS